MLTSRLDAYISRYGDFFANDDDNNNDTTDYFTPCACARGKNVKTGINIEMYYIMIVRCWFCIRCFAEYAKPDPTSNYLVAVTTDPLTY